MRANAGLSKIATPPISPVTMRRPNRWADLSLRTKCLLLIAFPAATTAMMAGAANILATQRSAAGDQLNHALLVEGEIQRFRAEETAVSAGVRAYFITSQEVFANQVRSSIGALDAARHQLLSLTAEDPQQQQRLASIASLEKEREEQMFGVSARFRSGPLPWDQVRAEVRAVESKRLQMEALLEAMDHDNQRQRTIRKIRTDALRAQQSVIIEICLSCGVFVGAGMTLLFASGITGRIRQLQRNVARLASGAPLDPLGGRDEIGVLNEGLLGLAELLRQKAVVLENALHGIAEVDASGHYLWLNSSYVEMSGCSRDSPPSHITLSVQPEDRTQVERAIAQMRVNGRAEIAARLDQPNVPAADVGMTFLATARDPASNFYVFLRDLWAGKRGDAALIRAKDAAIASNRAKTDFLARISHDIRTPLNAVLGAADLLSETPLNSDQAEHVRMFQRNCRSLVALLNDFLDFSRIEAGAVRVERVPVCVRQTVEEGLETFRQSAARKGIELGIEIDPALPEWTIGDPLRIRQVLVNLLSNALKFTATGRVDVKVKVLSAVSISDKLRFEVSDTGGGIRLEDQDKIFARFVQLPNQTSGQRGAGLGLSICRDLVELMGGTIGVVSREGSGSTFHFSLPLEAVDPALAKPDRIEAASLPIAAGHTVRILVAEDTEDNRLLLEHYLRGQPVQLRFAQNGQEAIDAIEQGERFGLILMDIDMPVLDGYAATKRIRTLQQSSGDATPIVALSADAMREAVRNSISAGCVAHIPKPVDRETLLKTIFRYAAPTKIGGGSPMAPVATISAQVSALVPQYLASKERQIEEARAALATRDFAAIRSFGHNLKGTGRGYGFVPIEAMGREIELAASRRDANRIAGQLDALDRFVRESAAQHGVYLDGKSNSHGSGSHFDPSGSRR